MEIFPCENDIDNPAHIYILAQRANATKSVFGNMVVFARAVARLFSKTKYQLLKLHTEYSFQLSVSSAPRNTPFYRGRMSS